MAHRPRSEMKGFKWKLRRMVDNIADFIQKGTNVQYSETSDALSRLLQAVGRDLMTARSRATPTVKRSAEGKIPKGPSRKYYQRCLRMQLENEKLRAKLTSHTAAKAGGNFISPDWIVQIFLTSPGQNARGLTQCFRDVVGLDTNLICTKSMDKVRGA